MYTMYYRDKQKGWMYNDNGNENYTWHMAVCLLEENLTRANRALRLKQIQKGWQTKWGEFAWSLQMSLKRGSDSKPSKDSAAKTRPIKSCRRIHISMGCQIQGTHGQAMNYDWPFNINSTLRICLHPPNT